MVRYTRRLHRSIRIVQACWGASIPRMGTCAGSRTCGNSQAITRTPKQRCEALQQHIRFLRGDNHLASAHLHSVADRVRVQHSQPGCVAHPVLAEQRDVQ